MSVHESSEIDLYRPPERGVIFMDKLFALIFVSFLLVSLAELEHLLRKTIDSYVPHQNRRKTVDSTVHLRQ